MWRHLATSGLAALLLTACPSNDKSSGNTNSSTGGSATNGMAGSTTQGTGGSTGTAGMAAATGDVAAGKTAVMKYGCIGCHGANLAGDADKYPGTTGTYAANLTPDKDTGLANWDAATIKTAILGGKDDEGEQLCPTMPIFKDMKMTDTEATDIVAYLKSVAAVNKKIPESDCGSGATGSASK